MDGDNTGGIWIGNDTNAGMSTVHASGAAINLIDNSMNSNVYADGGTVTGGTIAASAFTAATCRSTAGPTATLALSVTI
jgi:hypothetical protein